MDSHPLVGKYYVPENVVISTEGEVVEDGSSPSKQGLSLPLPNVANVEQVVNVFGWRMSLSREE